MFHRHSSKEILSIQLLARIQPFLMTSPARQLFSATITSHLDSHGGFHQHHTSALLFFLCRSAPVSSVCVSLYLIPTTNHNHQGILQSSTCAPASSLTFVISDSPPGLLAPSLSCLLNAVHLEAFALPDSWPCPCPSLQVTSFHSTLKRHENQTT